jgi:hypothetical protein
MSISMIVPLAIGNALRIVFVPPDGTVRTRVLRRADAAFTDQNDPGAINVGETDGHAVTDTSGLINGQTYFYAAAFFDGLHWSLSAAVSAVPAASYFDATVDVQTVLRDRIDAGMKVEVARGALLPQSGRIDVLTAPPVFNDKRLPMVTVHLENEAPIQRALGDQPIPDVFDTEGNDWQESGGWLGRCQLTIVCWSLNPDERLALRRALRRVLVANLPVFSDLGLDTVEFSFNDQADFQSFGIPVYQCVCSFSAMFAVTVADGVDAVTDVLAPGPALGGFI